MIAPRVRHLLGFEAPLHPAPLDEDQVSKKPEWRPPRREDAGGQLLFAQTVELGEQSGAVVAQLLQQDFPRILDRWGGSAAQLTHEGEASGEKFVHGADGVEFSVGPARRRRAAAFALLLWGRPIAAQVQRRWVRACVNTRSWLSSTLTLKSVHSAHARAVSKSDHQGWWHRRQSRHLGRRRSAYEIRKKSEGIYAVINLTAEPADVKELDRQFTINESIM